MSKAFEEVLGDLFERELDTRLAQERVRLEQAQARLAQEQARAEQAQARAEQALDANRKAVRLLLQARFGAVPPALEARIAHASLETLNALIDRVAAANSPAALLDEQA